MFVEKTQKKEKSAPEEHHVKKNKMADTHT